MRRARVPPLSGGQSGSATVVPAVMLSIQLCGVRPRNPCHTNIWRNPLHITPARVRSVAWPRGGCPKQGHSAGVASRLPRDPAFDGRPRPCQLSAAAALSAVRLARQPVPARSGLNGRGCRSHTAARCLSAGLAWPWSDSRAAVSEARPGSRSAYEAHPYALASEDAGERRERCLAPRQSAPLGVPSPESGRSPATATLAEQGGHAPVPTPPEPLLGSLRGRCGDDQLGPAPSARPGRGLRSGPSRDRTRRRAAGRSTRSMRLARRNLRWAHIPLAGPAPELCGVHFAKRVVRQGFCGPTPHNEILNITAGTSSCRAGFAPAEAQCLSWRTFVHDLAVE